jgi:hypothetical protein
MRPNTLRVRLLGSLDIQLGNQPLPPLDSVFRLNQNIRPSRPATEPARGRAGSGLVIRPPSPAERLP